MKATTEGTEALPSAPLSTRASPSTRAATAELLVPRSMPTMAMLRMAALARWGRLGRAAAVEGLQAALQAPARLLHAMAMGLCVCPQPKKVNE